ncbi:LOW QUALITY PROTEIN: putative cysteine proteinase CG12163 [Drosophila sulfurigaster albostrigata]|uniref:LOW QUALITY PROTEIN: putative cysteine proteinase CG12163 n=1 Tax=Drosophila sulfurigaster albostrigata TaxID=89887 RepID=UPI002D21CB3D|nr:LOW QUALITY PROTEIN: putative cysteine proteinase CG12163 [Drosophila sulfurigaster albostrigata]
MKLYAAATVALLLVATIQTTPAAAEEELEETTIAVSTDEVITEEPIKLVHVLNPGEREYLSPNLIGVQNIAMTFLPLSMNFVNIIDAFREIVNGVRYEILLNAIDTKAKDADTICRLVVLEKPWLTTQWGDKHRELVNSNCSDVADNALSPASDSEEREGKYLSRSERSIDNDIPILPGGKKPFDEKQAEKQLQNTLDKLTAGEGPHYRIVKVYSASRQVVSGTLTRIDADLIDGSEEQHRCIVEIWAQPWLAKGHDISFKCRNQPTVHARHSRSVEWAEKKTHKKHNHRTLNKVEHLFHKFQIKYNRRYANSIEHQMRLRIFRQNLRTIEELNSNERGSAKYGITDFADMTSTEYKQRASLWQRSENKPTGGEAAVVPAYAGDLPKEFDWRQKNAVTNVKNQGSCGSCWAFSVTGNIEGLYAVKTGDLQEFSEQELLDCDSKDSACNGGLMDNAYQAIKDIGGLEYESEYPYEGKKKSCHFNRTLSHVQVAGFVDLPKGNETAMQEWLVSNGPISIGINANAMQFYRGGVSHPWSPLCSKKNLDHGVLIVGYGVSDYPNFHKTLPYWIVKNSWGPRWGEQGYYRVYRGDNTCGVSEMATSAVLA